MINTDNSIAPLYQKVKDHILKKIKRGDVVPNSQIPSENELVATLKVSRMTANRALKELAAEGLLVQIAGVGTFVAEAQTKAHLVEVRNIAEEVRECGHTYSNIVVTHESVPLTSVIAAAMELSNSIKSVYHTTIVHQEDSKMLQVEDRYVNAQEVPEYIQIDLKQTTPAAYLLANVPLHKVEHTGEPPCRVRPIKKLLQMDDNVPCLILDRRTWSSGNLISVAHLYHSAQSFSLTETINKDY